MFQELQASKKGDTTANVFSGDSIAFVKAVCYMCALIGIFSTFGVMYEMHRCIKKWKRVVTGQLCINFSSKSTLNANILLIYLILSRSFYFIAWEYFLVPDQAPVWDKFVRRKQKTVANVFFSCDLSLKLELDETITAAKMISSS